MKLQEAIEDKFAEGETTSAIEFEKFLENIKDQGQWRDAMNELTAARDNAWFTYSLDVARECWTAEEKRREHAGERKVIAMVEAAPSIAVEDEPMALVSGPAIEDKISAPLDPRQSEAEQRQKFLASFVESEALKAKAIWQIRIGESHLQKIRQLSLIDSVLAHINPERLPDAQARLAALVALANNPSVTESQLDHILDHATSDNMPDSRHRAAVYAAALDNSQLTGSHLRRVVTMTLALPSLSDQASIISVVIKRLEATAKFNNFFEHAAVQRLHIACNENFRRDLEVLRDRLPALRNMLGQLNIPIPHEFKSLQKSIDEEIVRTSSGIQTNSPEQNAATILESYLGQINKQRQWASEIDEPMQNAGAVIHHGFAHHIDDIDELITVRERLLLVRRNDLSSREKNFLREDHLPRHRDEIIAKQSRFDALLNQLSHDNKVITNREDGFAEIQTFRDWLTPHRNLEYRQNELLRLDTLLAEQESKLRQAPSVFSSGLLKSVIAERSYLWEFQNSYMGPQTQEAFEILAGNRPLQTFADIEAMIDQADNVLREAQQAINGIDGLLEIQIGENQLQQIERLPLRRRPRKSDINEPLELRHTEYPKEVAAQFRTLQERLAAFHEARNNATPPNVLRKIENALTNAINETRTANQEREVLLKVATRQGALLEDINDVLEDSARELHLRIEVLSRYAVASQKLVALMC